MKHHLEAIVLHLKALAGKGDMASVQINNEGRAILRIGVSHEEFLTIDQLVTELEPKKLKDLEPGTQFKVHPDDHSGHSRHRTLTFKLSHHMPHKSPSHDVATGEEYALSPDTLVIPLID